MPHVFEAAPSGRAKCRGCGKAIVKGDIRFGERLPNPFAEGEMTLWFHPICAALKRPEPVLEALGDSEPPVESRERLEEVARTGIAHRRLPRIDGAERSPNARARCRSCRDPIPKGEWRISLVFYEAGRFAPSGYIHAGCSQEYFGTAEIAERVRHFAELGGDDLEEIARAAAAGPTPA
jgi:hypothetical protein